jgi:hypothetical protein
MYVQKDPYRWIEEPSSDAVEYPHIRHQGKGEGQRHIEKGIRTRICSGGGGGGVGDLTTDKCPEEEEKRSHKLADHRGEVVPCGIGETQHRKAALLGRVDREGRNAITKRHLEDEQRSNSGNVRAQSGWSATGIFRGF